MTGVQTVQHVLTEHHIPTLATEAVTSESSEVVTADSSVTAESSDT